MIVAWLAACWTPPAPATDRDSGYENDQGQPCSASEPCSPDRVCIPDAQDAEEPGTCRVPCEDDDRCYRLQGCFRCETYRDPHYCGDVGCS